VYYCTYLESNSVNIYRSKKIAGKNETFYAKYPVSVCLVVFKLIEPKGWRDLYFCYIISMFPN